MLGQTPKEWQKFSSKKISLTTRHIKKL
jgi:hypothetical protein